MISFTIGPASLTHRRVSKLPLDHPFRAKKGPAPSADHRRVTHSVLDQSKMQLFQGGLQARKIERALEHFIECLLE
jgi:hypothetical protein